ncbi:MAG: multidrug ABC transporter ATP-binding protein, partial [Planctomycetota bacterium]|nr:multidrug ABC transporter ATP-binding protein [Planctomycetota bacterium]
IEQGKLLFSGSVDEIMSRANVGQIIHIRVTDRAKDAAALLRTVDGIQAVELLTKNDQIRIDVTINANVNCDISELPNRLITKGFRIISMQEEQVNLETAFMRLTKGLVG